MRGQEVSDEQDAHKRRINGCRMLADQIAEFAEFATRRAGLQPVDLMIAMTTAILEFNKTYSKPGDELNSLHMIINGMLTTQAGMSDDEAAAEAMAEAEEARRRGQMQ